MTARGRCPWLASYANYLVYGADGLLGRALDIMVTPVMAFVVFGAAFEASGGGRALSSVALKLAERSRAGAIKACILASGMFGAVSGTAVSNVMTTGAFSIPSMRRIGVRNETAAGIEAAASTSGQIMPPVMGAAAFLLADFVAESHAPVALASRAASALTRADFAGTARAGLRFGWILFVMPFVVVAQPGLVLLGGWGAVLHGVLVALAFLLAASAPGLTAGLRTGLASLALGAVFWPGPGWIAEAVAVAIGGGVLLRPRVTPA